MHADKALAFAAHASPLTLIPARKSAQPSPQRMAQRYAQVRAHTLALAEPLSPEDQCIQSMPDASPSKWHQAHTSWFFESLVLQPHVPGYRVHDSRYAYLFNSYYESLGARQPRPLRGLLSRPALSEVRRYRRHVDQAMLNLISQLDGDEARWAQLAPWIELGLQHEQQHQELLVTDALHLLASSPLLPAYGLDLSAEPANPDAQVPVLHAVVPRHSADSGWLKHPGGVIEIGAPEDAPFAFDNERGRHPVLLRPFSIARHVVSCGEYAQFIEDGGYDKPLLWLSEGWSLRQAQQWHAPPYWRRHASGHWQVFGLQGLQAMDVDAPVSQLSYFEAAAYAAWAGARLPTEFEWEAAALSLPEMQQIDGAVWQWTGSAYLPYPGFKPLEGQASEYNGKFMVGQMVLRGGSLATPRGHSLLSYRNFFAPSARWQFSGLRLARDSH